MRAVAAQIVGALNAAWHKAERLLIAKLNEERAVDGVSEEEAFALNEKGLADAIELVSKAVRECVAFVPATFERDHLAAAEAEAAKVDENLARLRRGEDDAKKLAWLRADKVRLQGECDALRKAPRLRAQFDSKARELERCERDLKSLEKKEEE